MKVAIISDSHGNKIGIDYLFKNYTFDYLIHTGDGVGDLKLYSNLENVITVSGNCDIFSSEVEEKIVDICDKKIFVTHGHKYGVKGGLDRLIARGRECGADIVLYGHTHNANYMYEDNMLIINPGVFQRGKCVMLTLGDKISIENIEIKL
jgi:putative phosphoesterase